MKKVFFMVVAALFAVTMAKAQQPRGDGMRLKPEERAQRSVENLDKALTLNQIQKDSIYQFSLYAAKEQQTLFQTGRNENNREANFAKMRAIREKTQQKIKGVLTEDQQRAYDALVKEQSGRMGGRRGGRGA